MSIIDQEIRALEALARRYWSLAAGSERRDAYDAWLKGVKNLSQKIVAYEKNRIKPHFEKLK